MRKVVVGCALLALLGLMPFAFAKGPAVRFQGKIERVDLITVGQATLLVRLAGKGLPIGLNIPIQTNLGTEIGLGGDKLGLEELSIGDFVQITGYFSPTGIVAEMVEILDQREGNFRLRGSIGEVLYVSGHQTISVLGIPIVLDIGTRIDRRGSNATLSADALVTGMFVDVRGTRRNGQLLATRIRVGAREEDPAPVRFNGWVVSSQNGRIAIDVQGGGTAIVQTDASTTTRGAVTVGSFVEVQGTFNPELDVQARIISVDLNRDGDPNNDHRADVPQGSVQFMKVISLAWSIPNYRPSSEVRLGFVQNGGQVEEELEITIRDSFRELPHRIRVEIARLGTIEFGYLRTDANGSASIRYSRTPREGDRNLNDLLPLGTDARDIVRIEILTPAGLVLATGTF
jgi:hypothetical protein